MVVAELSLEAVRMRVGTDLPDAEATALVAWYANTGAGVASFPDADLRGVEPPLRSTPGPVVRR